MSQALRFLVFLLPFIFISAQADEAAEREAIGVEIEQLRYSGRLSVGLYWRTSTSDAASSLHGPESTGWRL
jgi:hypothetical protein